MIRVLASKLSKAVTFVNRALRPNPAQPIMENVHFVVSNERLYMRVTDLNTTLITSVELSEGLSSDNGLSFLVKAVDLAKLLGTMSSKDNDELLTVTPGNSFKVKFTWSTGAQTLTGGDVQLFPTRAKVDKAQAIALNFTPGEREGLLRSLSFVRFCCSTDELKPAMRGVNVIPWDNMFHTQALMLVASTGSMFACCPVEGEGLDAAIKANKPFIINVDFVATIADADSLSDKDHALTMLLTDRFIQVTIGDYILTSQLITERPMPYEFIFDSIGNHVKEFTCNRSEFSKALQRVLLTADELGGVSVSAAGKTVCLTSIDGQTGKETQENLPLLKPYEETFNANFIGKVLQKIVSNSDETEITIRYKDSVSSILFYGSNKDIFALCMPLAPTLVL